MNFVSLINSSIDQQLFFVTGKEHGEDCWFYLKADKIKLPIFRNLIKTGRVRLYEYGTILHSGWGKAPPLEISEKFKDKLAAA